MFYNNFYIIFKFMLRLITVYTLYKPLYNSCNKRVKHTTKKGETKSVTKSKTLLSMIYYLLIWLIVINMTPRLLIVLVFMLTVGGLYSYDTFLSSQMSRLYAYDHHRILRYGWKIFAAINLMIYLLLNPLLDYGWMKIKSKYGKYIAMAKLLIDTPDQPTFQDSQMSQMSLDSLMLNKKNDLTSCMSDYMLQTESIDKNLISNIELENNTTNNESNNESNES